MPRNKFYDAPGEKTCRKCEIVYKECEKHFFKGAHGLQSYCRTCCNKDRRDRYANKTSHNHKRICRSCSAFFWTTLAAINMANRKGRQVLYCSVPCIIRAGGKVGRKGVSWNGARRGENNPSAKLKESQVKDIREKLKNGAKPRGLAIYFGVSEETIWNIKYGTTWKHVV